MGDAARPQANKRTSEHLFGMFGEQSWISATALTHVPHVSKNGRGGGNTQARSRKMRMTTIDGR